MFFQYLAHALHAFDGGRWWLGAFVVALPQYLAPLMDARIAHLFSVDEWFIRVPYDGLLLWIFLRLFPPFCGSPVWVCHHTDGDVSAVGLRAILLSPTGIEELGVDVHLVASELVGQFLPFLHTVLVWPQPYGATLVDQRLHGFER